MQISKILTKMNLGFSEEEDEESFYENYVLARLGYSRLTAYLGGLLVYIFFVWDYAIDSVKAPITHEIRGFILTPIVLISATLTYVPAFRKYIEAIFLTALICVTVGLCWIYCILRLGFNFGVTGMMLIVIYSVAILPFRTMYLLILTVIIGVVFTPVQIISRNYSNGMLTVNIFLLTSSLSLAMISTVHREWTARSEYLTKRDLLISRRRVDDLLYSMLPASIVKRIQDGETAIADAYGELSIVFVDLVGFTNLSRRISPTHLVEMLNRLFTEFDECSASFGLERIKTIGDAYMAVGGLTKGGGRDDHAASAADFALAAHKIVESIAAEMSLPIHVRVGLHVGPVVAGVIGTRRPAFDCWGEAVNLASRLETSASVGAIYISEAAYMRVGSDFMVEALDDLEIRGVGPTKAFILTGRKAHDQRGSENQT